MKADLPPDEAAANVAYLKQMLKGRDDPHGRRGVPVARSASRIKAILPSRTSER